MKLTRLGFIAAITFISFKPVVPGSEFQLKDSSSSDPSFVVEADRFADIAVLRYRIEGFEKLSVQQKQLAWYLYQAGLSGRDIFFDQKHAQNLRIRKNAGNHSYILYGKQRN